MTVPTSSKQYIIKFTTIHPLVAVRTGYLPIKCHKVPQNICNPSRFAFTHFYRPHRS